MYGATQLFSPTLALVTHYTKLIVGGNLQVCNIAVTPLLGGTMQVRLFGRLSETSRSEVEVYLPGACSIALVRSTLIALYPAAAAQLVKLSVRACVGNQIVAESFIVEPGQVVEFLPAVSGG